MLQTKAHRIIRPEESEGKSSNIQSSAKCKQFDIYRQDKGYHSPDNLLIAILGADQVAQLDRFDRCQLLDVVLVCKESHSISEAGRRLFSVSRAKKRQANDADRLRKYLNRFNLTWTAIKESAFS